MKLQDLYREVGTKQGFSGSEFWITINHFSFGPAQLDLSAPIDIKID